MSTGEPDFSSSLSDTWAAWALDPPRAFGAPLGVGTLRAQVEDFVVEEDLGFAPAGAGQHRLLKVSKRNANTHWVARELARFAGCRPADVGYAGLKDRRALAIQWFSVPASGRTLQDWTQLRTDDFQVLEAHAHTRKLPRGALAANHFVIRVRDMGEGISESALAARIELIARRGVPNYFGPQRFGRDGANLARANADLRTLRQPERGFVLSAARSLIFNAVAASRVAEGSWEHLVPGDLANLDARGSVFPVDIVDATLRERCERLEIHPTGPLWGRDAPRTGGAVLEMERQISAQLDPAPPLVARAGMEQERRSLRLAVRDLQSSLDGSHAVIRFRLARGAYATTVLREIFTLRAGQEGAAESDSED